MSELFAKNVQQHLEDCFSSMSVINHLLSGRMEKEALKKMAKRHYAEIRSFTDIKLPARMYLCPHDAWMAKKYFSTIYVEEQGNFNPQEHHANLFKPVCYALGLTDTDLEAEYDFYCARYHKMWLTAPSSSAMIRELAISLAWESFIGYFGKKITSILKEKYQLEETDLKYFDIHFNADNHHSQIALETLVYYTKSPELEKIAIDAITETLVTEIYLKVS